jgi:ABC-type transport system involved in multi-copper enzyme maturation permease subunit
MNPRDIWVIARFDVARHLRSRHTLVAAILLVLCCAYGSYRLAEFADQFAELGREAGPALDMVAGMVEGLTDLPVSDVRRLLTTHPPVLVALFALVLGLLPLLCLMLGYDQTATDIETRHVRYLLFRSDRTSLYLGKAIGALLMISGAVALGLGVVATSLALRSDALEGIEGLLYLLRIWLTATFFALPMVALLGLFSALIGRARRALSVTFSYWIAVGIAAGVAGLKDESFANLRYLFPAAGRFNLLFDQPKPLLMIGTYELVFTLVVGGLGLWWFRRRDL